MPVSDTVNVMPVDTFSTIKATSPAGVNLMALVSKLSSICLMLRSSAMQFTLAEMFCSWPIALGFDFACVAGLV